MLKPEISSDLFRSVALKYGLAVVSVLGALGLALLGQVYAVQNVAFPLLLSAIAITIWYAGNGPGALALLIAVLSFSYFFSEPRYSFYVHPADRPLFLLFTLFAFIMAWFSARRRRIERELREAHDKLEIEVAERTQQASLLNLTHDTIFVRDMSDVITYWNRGAEELYGWKKEEAIGEVSHQLTQTIFSAPLEKINEELLGTGRWEGELIHTKRDGTEVVVASRWSLQRDEQGTPIAILETNNDITERKRAEEALRKSEEQWRDVFEHNPTMYFIVDQAGIVLSVNPFGAEQLGYTVDELIGDSVLKVFYEPDRDAAKERVALCLEQPGRSMSWELRKIRKNGTMLWVRETARAVLRANGPIVLVACEDITDRKRAEEELAKTEQRLRAVIANTPIILFALDRSGVFTLSEGRGLDDLGLKPGQVVGQSGFDMYHDTPQVLSAVRRALAGESFSEIVEVNGLIFETHYIPVLDEGGKVAGVNGVAINVTEHRRAEETLRNTEAELAHVARVGTLGEMTASIAHEINQPLGAVVNNASACLRWLAAHNIEEARRSAELIRADGHRAAEIIQRIRSYAKKTPPQKDWIDINQTIREVIALARNEMQRNGITLETRFSDDIHYVSLVFADRIQLQQVILNLIMNAVEAMSETNDSPRELLIRTGTDSSREIVVAVQDSGPGLDPQNLDRLFTPFYTTKPQGMGMGLAICRSIVEAHGGRLRATANEDRGATFQFTLPTGDDSTARLV